MGTDQYAWIDVGGGRSVYRRISEPSVARSDLACPMLITDAIDPTQSQADGQYYTSKSSLRATYKASGNPQGREYVEVGNDQRPREQKRGSYVRDKVAAKDAVERAMARVDRGEIA